MSETDKNRILVVEDEDNLRELVRCRLEANGYEVAVAEDGYKALAGVRSFNPDLIILDLMLPKMDGYSVCRMLKSEGDSKAIPIILFTARTSDDDRRHGLDMGADSYINKPFDPLVLLGKIKELLDPETYAAEHPVEADAETSSPEDVAEAPEDAPEPGPPEPEPEAESVPDSSPEPVAEVKPPPVEEPEAETTPEPEPDRPEPAADKQLSPNEQAARVRPPAPEAEEATDESEAHPGFFARLFRRLFKPASED